MDHRTPLKLHTVLAFEGMSCHIEEVIGQGSNAIVYKGWYQDNLNRELRHHVLVKELFPFHPQQQIYRAEDCHIVIEPEAEELWETHKKSFEIGNQIHLRLLYDHPDMMVMGANLNSFQFNGTLYSVLGYTGGRSLQTELNKTNVSLRHTAQRMIGLLDALEAFHKSGYLHLDISPDNIMLVGQEEQERIFLIDYNSAREAGSRDSNYLSCKAGYSAPEVSTGNLDAMGFASDLYSAAAVFFRCIMGRSLTLTEMLQPKAPDCQDSPLLKDMPQTVSAMVGSILKKGLHTLSKRRYQSIGQMRQAFQELLDRIDCVGVTHWSLWENGKRSAEELIRINPSLRYLKDEKKLYPIRLEQEYSMSLERYLDNLLSPEGKSGMILAQGGMGKTTLLLHTAMLQGKRYSAATPAVFYISLNGWEKADTRYIRSQILMRLRFKKEENTFDSAMHALHKLLEQPIKTKQGELPTVLLLLDGLNEVRGDIAPLVQEINELSKMAGVRILATSRTEVPELELETAALMPLNVEDIEEALGRNGLLIPRKQEVIQLLRTPLILSIYIQASEGGRQLNIRNEDELMKAYMDSLLEKEIQQLPEDSPLRWQIDVALNYVLPAIAAEVKKKGHALTKERILVVIKKCQKLLRSIRLQKAFPQWIGHTKEIFYGTVKTDEWYSVIVNEILWQHLGLLLKDTDDRYRIFHQGVYNYLLRVYRVLAPRTRQHTSPITLFGLIWCILILLSIYRGHMNVLEQQYADIGTSYWRSKNSITNSFTDALDTIEIYLSDSNDYNYQLARSATNQAMRDVERSLANAADIRESDLSKMDGLLLNQTKRKLEYLQFYCQGYISNIPLSNSTYLPSVKNDYVSMLCTLDILLEFYHQQIVHHEDVLTFVKIARDLHCQREVLIDLLYEISKTYNHDASKTTLDKIENTGRMLENLSYTFREVYTTYSPQMQQQIWDRIDIFLNPYQWTNRLGHDILSIPSCWTAPSWLAENPDYYYAYIDTVSLEIKTKQYNPTASRPGEVPFTWYTVCFDISREDFFHYFQMLERENISYNVNDYGAFIQASVHFSEVDLTINWTDLHTVLILTGFDNPEQGNGGVPDEK